MLACATAETIGIAAASGAARASESTDTLAGFGLIVAGGLVEGTALGLLQARALRDLIAPRRAWVLATVLVAGLGWAAGSAPATLQDDASGTAPALGLVLLGAAGLGLVMGAVLGAAQAVTLRHRVRHPWRWVTANVCGWAVAMPVIFAGASTAGASWPWPLLVAYGALTGALAGCCLGLVTGPWLRTLDGPPLRHRQVLAFLRWRRRDARDGWTGLAVTGRTSGRTFAFPVMTAPCGPSGLVVLPGHPERKSWWRNLRPATGTDTGTGAEVGVLDRGSWRTGRARLVEAGSMDWSIARSAYAARWPDARVGEGPLVTVELLSPRPPGDEGPADTGPGAMGTDVDHF